MKVQDAMKSGVTYTVFILSMALLSFSTVLLDGWQDLPISTTWIGILVKTNCIFFLGLSVMGMVISGVTIIEKHIGRL